jgi:hypothetical protein
MPLSLPPKTAQPTPENIRALEAGLTSAVAGHPQSIEPWTFYEELDRYVGPWGNKGYPIAYGKFYCIAFNTNEKLMANAQTAEWVRKTTIKLQEPLRDFIVARFRNGTLPKLTESELRQYAFSVHPAAYDSGGLAMVTIVATELIPVIATIPAAEFDPRSDNFGPTIKQVRATLVLIGNRIAGISLGAMAGPAHTGLLRHAAEMDRGRMLQELALGRYLNYLKLSIKRGDADDINALNGSQIGLTPLNFRTNSLLRWRARLFTTPMSASGTLLKPIAPCYNPVRIFDNSLTPQNQAGQSGKVVVAVT